MLFYAQKMPKNDLFAHASQYCMGSPQGVVALLLSAWPKGLRKQAASEVPRRRQELC